MRGQVKMNDRDLLLQLINFDWADKTYIRTAFFKDREKLGRVGKSPPIFYSKLKQLINAGVVEETKSSVSGKKILRRVDEFKTIRKPAKTEFINNETFFQPSDLENQLVMVRAETERLRRKMARDRMVLENYIMYLQEQIKDMKDLEIQRLNMEKNRNKMRETNE
tara:strand:+ start:23 stop:517 length:495 start_codon:yes stop_codon:yes gene_type:complete